MKPLARSLLLAATLAMALGLATGRLNAQGKSPGSSSLEKATSAQPAYALEITDGVFKHRGKVQEATLANVVDALRDMFPDDNIVMVPELAKIRVADLKLRATDMVDNRKEQIWRPGALEESLAALRVATGNRFIWRNGVIAEPVDPTTGLPASQIPAPMLNPATGLPIPAAPAESSRLWCLYADPGAARSRRTVEVFNLHGYLSISVSPDGKDEKGVQEALLRIESIVTTTLEQLNQGSLSAEDKPDFQFHPGASLLIVIGPPEAIEVARKVVTALPYYGGPGAGFPSLPPAAPASEAVPNPYISPDIVRPHSSQPRERATPPTPPQPAQPGFPGTPH